MYYLDYISFSIHLFSLTCQQKTSEDEQVCIFRIIFFFNFFFDMPAGQKDNYQPSQDGEGIVQCYILSTVVIYSI
jgi:hypothetical protein